MKTRSPDKSELIRVKASAGAGKTYALSTRFLALLSRSSPSRDVLKGIVAITFTNKAAYEMRQRIIGHLKEIALNGRQGDSLKEATGLSQIDASNWIDVILDHFSDFHIRTIDSFLFSILNALSFDLGMAAELNAVFDATQPVEDAFFLVLEDALINCPQIAENALNTYFDIDERGGFYPEYGLLKRLSDLFPLITDGLLPPPISCSQWNKLKDDLISSYKRFFNAYKGVKDALKGNLTRGIIERMPVDEIVNKKIFKRDVEDLFKKNFRPSQGNKSFHNDDKVKEFKEAFNTLKQTIEKYIELRPYIRVSGYSELLVRMKKEVDAFSIREGVIYGSEYWTRIIKDKIVNNGLLPVLFSHFDGRLVHFLFDEFQDTSRGQWDALMPIFDEALSMGGSLFIVGDLKQAIYGWRGGDMRLFDEVLTSFPAIDTPKSHVLKYNYRSCKTIVHFVNALFSQLQDKTASSVSIITSNMIGKDTPLTVKDDISTIISSCYSDVQQTPKVNSPKGMVKIFLCDADKGADIEDAVKAQFLREMEGIRAGQKEGDIQKDIACLVRSNKDGEIVSKWLFERGIPAITENSLMLKDSRDVRTIVSALRAVFYEDDEASLYALLKTEAIKKLMGIKGDINNIYEEWLRRKDGILNELRLIIKDSLRNKVLSRGPYEAIYEVINFLGLNHDSIFISTLLETSYQFDISIGGSISSFLNFLETDGLSQRVMFEGDIENNAVKILTIHKAKGLEFNTVFIPFTNWRIQGIAPIDLYKNRLVHLSTPLPDELLKRRSQLWAREAIELLNLLYVAFTRAIEALYLFVTIPKKGGLAPISKCLKELILSIGHYDKTDNLDGLKELEALDIEIISLKQ